MAGFAYGLGMGVQGAEEASQANLAGQQRLAEMQAQQAQTQSAQLQNQQLQDRLTALPQFGQMMQKTGGEWDAPTTAFALQHQIITPEEYTKIGVDLRAKDYFQGVLKGGVDPTTNQPLSDNLKYLIGNAIATHDYSKVLGYGPLEEQLQQLGVQKATGDVKLTNAQATSAEKEAAQKEKELELKRNQILADTNLSITDRNNKIAMLQYDIDDKKESARQKRMEADNIAVTNLDKDSTRYDKEFHDAEASYSKLWGSGTEGQMNYRHQSLLGQGYEPHQIWRNAPAGAIYKGTAPAYFIDKRTGMRVTNPHAGHPIIAYPDGTFHTTDANGMLS